MLNDAVKTLKGETRTADFATTVELEVDAYIPPAYIVNEQQKLDIYKRIAGVETPAESEDMKEELLDRFGQVPVCVENLLRIALIRVKAHSLYITEVKSRDEGKKLEGALKLQLRPDALLRVENIPGLLRLYGSALSFSAKGTPYFLLRYKKEELAEKDAQKLLERTEELLSDMEKLLKMEESV